MSKEQRVSPEPKTAMEVAFNRAVQKHATSKPKPAAPAPQRQQQEQRNGSA